MKRNTIIAVLLIAAGTMSAQEKMISVFPAERQLPAGLVDGKGVRMPDETLIKIEEPTDFESIVTEGDERPVLFKAGQRPARKLAAADAQAGYLNPEGTLFLGYTSDGKNTFIKSPGVIGAWAHDLKCWKWTNTTTGSYSSIDYQNGFLAKYPTLIEDGEYYWIDANYNFYDSIVGGQGGYPTYKDVAGDEGYIWQMGTPLQIVHRGNTDEKYMMFKKTGSSVSASNCPWAVGGLPSSNTSDGLWPLTNAVSTGREGQSNVLTYTDENNQKCYYFGTSKYDSHMPAQIITHYDKPQRQLYVKSISVLLGSNGTMAFDTLHVDVVNMDGNIIAQSDAAFSSLTTVKSPSGKMLTFFFEEKTSYNELLNEGFSVNEEFSVILSGIKDGDNFGIWSAKSDMYDSKSTMVYDNESLTFCNYDPYIMLNGIYPTLEDYVLAENSDAETGMVGDTIPVKFNLTEGLTYKYGATYAVNTEYTGVSEFAFYSTMKPYDADTRYWNLHIERPSYITMTADYEYNIGSDDDPVTLWQYYRLFSLYIYADSKPVIGDCIKISEYGKQIVFRIDEVMDENASSNTLARKLMNNGKLMIVRGDKTYNAQGQLVE